MRACDRACVHLCSIFPSNISYGCRSKRQRVLFSTNAATLTAFEFNYAVLSSIFTMQGSTKVLLEALKHQQIFMVILVLLWYSLLCQRICLALASLKYNIVKCYVNPPSLKCYYDQ